MRSGGSDVWRSLKQQELEKTSLVMVQGFRGQEDLQEDRHGGRGQGGQPVLHHAAGHQYIKIYYNFCNHSVQPELIFATVVFVWVSVYVQHNTVHSYCLDVQLFNVMLMAEVPFLDVMFHDLLFHDLMFHDLLFHDLMFHDLMFHDLLFYPLFLFLCAGLQPAGVLALLPAAADHGDSVRHPRLPPQRRRDRLYRARSPLASRPRG